MRDIDWQDPQVGDRVVIRDGQGNEIECFVDSVASDGEFTIAGVAPRGLAFRDVMIFDQPEGGQAIVAPLEPVPAPSSRIPRPEPEIEELRDGNGLLIDSRYVGVNPEGMLTPPPIPDWMLGPNPEGEPEDYGGYVDWLRRGGSDE